MMHAPVLRAQDLCYHVADRLILAPLSLTLSPGQWLAVVGPNGAGKSTLLKLLAGHLPASQGWIELCGRLLGQWSARERAQQLAVLHPREPLPAFALRLKDYVALGRTPYQDWLGRMRPGDWQLVQEALAQTGLTPLAEQDIRCLSSGEWQKAQLARALAQTPRCLLLDEPTSHLDIQAEVEIMHLLRQQVQAGLAVMTILHDLNLAAHFSDALLLLHHGRVQAQGPPSAVMRPEVLTQVYGPFWAVETSASGRPRIRPHYEGFSP